MHRIPPQLTPHRANATMFGHTRRPHKSPRPPMMKIIVIAAKQSEIGVQRETLTLLAVQRGSRGRVSYPNLPTIYRYLRITEQHYPHQARTWVRFERAASWINGDKQC